MYHSFTVTLSRHVLYIKIWLNIAWKIVILSLLFTKGFILKKSILDGRDLGENVCKIWKTFCKYQIHGRQKEAISLVLKYDFGAHRKICNLFQHITLNTLVV